MNDTCEICLGVMEEEHDCLGYEMASKFRDGMKGLVLEATYEPTFENKTMAMLSIMLNFVIDTRKDLNHLVERLEND